MYDRPISERHRIIFYLGHLEAFDWNLLADRAFGLKPFQRTFDQLFSFGIDPVGGGLPTDTPVGLAAAARKLTTYTQKHSREVGSSHWRGTRASAIEAIHNCRTMLEVAIEHRLMHAETLAYMLHRLPSEKKIGEPIVRKSGKARVKTDLVEIPAGQATLGLVQEKMRRIRMGQRMEAHQVDVPAFAIEKCNVTNRRLFCDSSRRVATRIARLWDDESWDWKNAENVEHPAFWRRDGNLWMYRGMFGEVRLPLDWPVYVSHAEATAYANWLGRKLPTEAQFHRAAYGSPEIGGTRAILSLGRRSTRANATAISIFNPGIRQPGGIASGGRQRFWRAGSGGQRMGMDTHGICAVPGI